MGAFLDLLGDAKTVERPIERADVDAPVRNGQPAEVIERRDLIAARPERLAGLAVERVQNGVRRSGDTRRRAARARGIGTSLHRAFAAAEAEDNAVRDH